jgi:N-acetylmuramoyl-L-alanine amidase
MPSRSELGATLNLKIDQIAEGRPNRPGTPIQPARITIHNTDNTNMGADAEAHARFVKNTGYYVYKGKRRYVSWHYTVDDDSCVRHLPLNELGWHAGSAAGNAGSIGIEICMNAGIDQNEAFDRAQRLIACLCYDLGLDPDTDVVPHMHWSGKKCPSLLLNNGELGTKWRNFLRGAKVQLDSIDEPEGV